MTNLSNLNLSSTSKTTPIKVRGKQSKKRPQPFISTPLANSSSNNKRVKRRRHEQRRLPSSRLEALPTEILEKLFLLSLNPHLALASPHILVKLSHRHTLLEFTVKCFGYLKSLRGEHLVIYDDLPLKPDRRVLDARAQVLRSPWMSYQILVRVKELVIQRGYRKLAQLAPNRAPGEVYFSGLELWLGPETVFPARLFLAAPVPYRIQFLLSLQNAGVSMGSTDSYINEMATELILYGVRTQDRNIINMSFYKLNMLPTAEQMISALESIDYDLKMVEALEYLYFQISRRSQLGKKPFERICAALGPKASERIKYNIEKLGGLREVLNHMVVRLIYEEPHVHFSDQASST